MNTTIMKFGGTSVEGASAFENVAGIVRDRQERHPVVVVSAMARFTDALFESVAKAVTIGAAAGIEELEKHFDRHRRVIDSLLRGEAERMRALIDQSRAEISQLLQTAAVELKDVCFRYHAERPVLSAVNVSVNAGERVALAGTSGNGKSTIAKLVARLYDARILLGPRVLRGCDEWNERERHDY